MNKQMDDPRQGVHFVEYFERDLTKDYVVH